MRIIAGQWRGRKLVAPKGDATRPTADRVRETLFSMLGSRLGSWEGLVLLDLFAGSGALALEGLSRGAAEAFLVEADRAARAAIRANIALLGAPARLIGENSLALPPASRAADVLFLDPPYGEGLVAPALAAALAQGWIALGDLLRQQEKFAQAVPAYDKALSLLGDQAGEARWFPLYARGIALERSGQFDRAEADFRAALKLRPDSAQVLNYLGYSFLEQGRNFDEALSMIERAVAARPEDGYIVDSLAWAYYRTGRYDKAVAPMERAVELMPVDPVVNDHLGDVYWAVGRKREAEFQWRRALSFKPDTEEEAARIRRKLEIGLDAVLAAEGAAPLSVSHNGN
jgi:16S rRNA (guanine(966)-N(2))-methyltransferase RsmD